MYLMFPVEWRFGDDQSDGFGGAPPDDAGTMYVVREDSEDLPVKDAIWNDVIFKTSLTEVVLESLAGWRSDGYTDEAHIPASDALAAALRKAADMLDAGKRPTSGDTLDSIVNII